MTSLSAPASLDDGAGPATDDPAGPRGDRPRPAGRGEQAFLLAGAIGLAVAVIATRPGVFTPDTRPDLYQQPGRFLAQALQAWVGGSSGLGQANFNAGAAPVAVVVWLIRAVGASPWLAVRIWRLLVMLVGAWGIRRYLSVLLGRRLTATGRTFATVFWLVNPYVIVAGSTTPILLPYAILPWTLLAFLQATRHPTSWRWPAAFALAFFAQTGLNAGVVPFFQLLALPAHLVHARFVEGRRWRDLWRVVWRCGVLCVLVSIYWLLPSLLASSTGAGIAGSTENPHDVARTSSYAETARLLGNWPLYGRAGDRLFLGSYTVYLTNALVVVATFLTPFGVGLSLWAAKARERLLTIALLATGLPVMVGLFPPDRPYTVGRIIGHAFDTIPATLAFRTTNKVGAVVVLGEVIALVLGLRAVQSRWRVGSRPRTLVGAVVVLALVGGATPLWNGGLYPLGYRIPMSWHQATRALDAHDPASRVLVVPGGTGGNYRWGMRSPDDLFPSLLKRPVAVRNTVVSRGDPSGNLLSAFDSALAEGSLPPDALSTVARYLGASDVLVRNDLLTEEISGPAPAAVTAAADADPGLVRVAHYGTKGTDTIPNSSGPATGKAAADDTADAKLYPLITYRVKRPEPIVRAAPASAQVLVDGDGDAVDTLSQAGLIDGSQPLLELGDLDRRTFARAVADGGRIVLTDTNRRRAWDINRTGDATTATLSARADIDSGNGTTTTRWPDDPAKQTVTAIDGAASITASRPGFGVLPFHRPSNAFDGDPSTSWDTGGFHTAAGAHIAIDFGSTRTVRRVTLTPSVSQPSSITLVSVQIGNTTIRQPMPSDGSSVEIPIKPTKARRVVVTILAQSKGDNPVGFDSIGIDDLVVREITRLPDTFDDLVNHASLATRRQVAAAPLDIDLARAQGGPGTADDDEEAQLDRRWTLPAPRVFTFTAELSVNGSDGPVVAQALQGNRPCTPVAALDGAPVRARVTSTAAQIAAGEVLLQGCSPLLLASGTHDLDTLGWRLDRVHLSSSAPAARAARAARPRSVAGDPTLHVTRSTPSRMDLTIGAGHGARLLRLGQAWDDRWTLSVDGVDAGPPLVVDGYSTGWRIDAKAHRLQIRFGPQVAVRTTFALSVAGVVGVVAVMTLPAVAFVPPWRRRFPWRRRPEVATGGVAP